MTVSDIDPDQWYSLAAARQLFPGPGSDAKPISAITLLAWCRRYGILPGERHGYWYLSGAQVLSLLELTTPKGAVLPDAVRAKRRVSGKQRKEIEEARRILNTTLPKA